MLIKVNLIWGGLIAEGEEALPEPEPEYYLTDANTAQLLPESDFSSFKEMEAYIATRYPDAGRWVPTPPPADKAEKLALLLDIVEGPEGHKMNLGPGALRNFFIGALYQWGHPADIEARIRSALAGGK